MNPLFCILCCLGAALAIGEDAARIDTADPQSSQYEIAEVKQGKAPVLKKRVLYQTIIDSLVDAPLRTEPDDSSVNIFKVGPGAAIDVLERGDVYYKVRVEGVVGYVLRYRLSRQ